MSDAPQRGQLFKCPVCKYRGGNPTSVWRDHVTVIHAAAIQDLGLTVDDVNEIGPRCSRSFSFPDIVAAPDVNFLEVCKSSTSCTQVFLNLICQL